MPRRPYSRCSPATHGLVNALAFNVLRRRPSIASSPLPAYRTVCIRTKNPDEALGQDGLDRRPPGMVLRPYPAGGQGGRRIVGMERAEDQMVGQGPPGWLWWRFLCPEFRRPDNIRGLPQHGPDNRNKGKSDIGPGLALVHTAHDIFQSVFGRDNLDIGFVGVP